MTLELNPELVRDAEERDSVIDLLQFTKKCDKPECNDISAQGAEFKSIELNWKVWWVMEMGCLCREFVGSGKS